MDEMLEDSDWFGTAPSVSLNSLSPFMLDLISDHSFQSVLKDLRDLYAIRNNLEGWKRRQDDFDVIIGARSASDRRSRAGNHNMSRYAKKQTALQVQHEALVQRAARLDREERDRVTWLLDDIQSKIGSAAMLVELLGAGSAEVADTRDYARLVRANMDVLEQELARTNELIGKVEHVLLGLINAELDIHEERLKYYRVQAHLAKARILDSSLASLDGRLDDSAAPEPQAVAEQGGANAP
jgi:hypothetical protein